MGILNEISNGEFDSMLDTIITSAQHRKKAVAINNVGLLSQGDEIKIRDCRPKYLVGQRATVVTVRGDKVEVRMGYMPGRPRFSEAVIAVPATMIERI